METIIISAVSKNGVIGRQGEMPWYIPEDSRRFRALTMGNAVLMGRKTYESISEERRPLAGRRNLVLSRTVRHINGAMVFDDLTSAVWHSKKVGEKELYICGGREVYQNALEIADRIELTKVHLEVEGDVYFPQININDWEQISGSERYDSKRDIKFEFLSYVRRE